MSRLGRIIPLSLELFFLLYIACGVCVYVCVRVRALARARVCIRLRVVSYYFTQLNLDEDNKE